MEKRASENKFLIVSSGVILTDIIEPKIVALDAEFEKAGLKALVTSGLRYPENQLNIIRKYLVTKGLKEQYSDTFTKDLNDKIESVYGEIYAWQLGWSRLLNIGVIINPPIAAHCLLDYFRNGVNKKNQLIHGSPHFPDPKRGAFDVGGAGNGISDEHKVIQEAIASKRIPGLINCLAERENNAIHCDCVL